LALAPTLASVEALYRKMERELYRAFHHRDRIHKADHFANFCITAHSMRDHFLERMGKIADSDRQPYHDMWVKEPLLVAASEIANSTKHFVLRDRRKRAPRQPKTKRVRLGRNHFAEVYVSADGRAVVVPQSAPDIFVVLGDNTRHDLYSFMTAILKYWEACLKANGIRVRRQPFAKLRG
jgi:hypothetical protein